MSSPSRSSITRNGQLGRRVDAGVEHLDDVGRVDGGRRPRLALEAAHQGRVLRHLGGDQLDGHAGAGHRVDGLVHGSHAAGADEPHDPVALADHRAVHAAHPIRSPGSGQLQGLAAPGPSAAVDAVRPAGGGPRPGGARSGGTHAATLRKAATRRPARAGRAGPPGAHLADVDLREPDAQLAGGGRRRRPSSGRPGGRARRRSRTTPPGGGRTRAPARSTVRPEGLRRSMFSMASPRPRRRQSGKSWMVSGCRTTGQPRGPKAASASAMRRLRPRREAARGVDRDVGEAREVEDGSAARSGPSSCEAQGRELDGARARPASSAAIAAGHVAGREGAGGVADGRASEHPVVEDRAGGARRPPRRRAGAAPPGSGGRCGSSRGRARRRGRGPRR